MALRTWAWLIGMTDDADARLVERAKSLATPPTLEIRGGRVGFDAYVPERRALKVDVEDHEITMAIRPGPPCVDPIFEFIGAAKGPIRVLLDGQTLAASRYAWDGATLWLEATIREPAELRIVFSAPPRDMP
jgi:hypothetical protein